jgi:hypothetical protein
MHLNLHDDIGSYDLSAIFDRAIEAEPWLIQAGIDTEACASFVIGRYFAHNLRDQVMVALALGSRVIDISLHPLIAVPLAHYLRERHAVETHHLGIGHPRHALSEEVVECDLHNDPQVDPLVLVREVVKDAQRPADLPRALARLTLDRIWSRIEAVLLAGGHRIHLLVPANAADLSGSFRDAA